MLVIMNTAAALCRERNRSATGRSRHRCSPISCARSAGCSLGREEGWDQVLIIEQDRGVEVTSDDSRLSIMIMIGHRAASRAPGVAVSLGRSGSCQLAARPGADS